MWKFHVLMSVESIVTVVQLVRIDMALRRVQDTKRYVKKWTRYLNEAKRGNLLFYINRLFTETDPVLNLAADSRRAIQPRLNLCKFHMKPRFPFG